MESTKIEQLKERLLELDPCIEFDTNNEDKLIGYAERFGGHFLPLYEGINTFLTKNPEEAKSKAIELSDKVCVFEGLDSNIIGYVIFDDQVAILHDKELYLNSLANEYKMSGMEIDEEFESYYSNALEWYNYNVIGTGMSDMTTPAFACTDEFSIISQD